MPRKSSNSVRKIRSGSPKQTARRRQPKVPLLTLGKRSSAARDRGLHVIAFSRRHPEVPFYRAARLHGVKPGTVRKYFPSDLKRSKGRIRVSKKDRHKAILNLPDAQGQIVPRQTGSSEERSQASQFLRDLNRYQRGRKKDLKEWEDRTIGGINLLTDPEIIKAVEPALSDFPMYRIFNGGAA